MAVTELRPLGDRLARESRTGEPVPLRVFVGSASGALAAYRQAAVDACHRLRLTPVHMEEFDPQRPTPEQVCRREVDSSDVFVLLLAHRYGARPPGRDLSYTELEYRWAAERPDMPLLAFVAAPNFPWPPDDIDHGADGEALARLVAEVKSQHEIRSLAEISAFRENLLIALGRLEAASSAPGQRKSVQKAQKKKEGPPDKARPTAPEFLAVPPYVGSAPFTGRAGDLAVLDEWGRSADPVMVVEAIGGTGKSALTWKWAQDQAPAVVGGLAGRLWWSFYEGSASMTRFLQELLGYTSARPAREIRRLPPADLADEVLTRLRSRPYLVVLDGFERLLAAYHRFDPSKLRDEEADTGQRSLIEANADEVVRQLAAAGPSKILISTRLMPLALQGRFRQQMPGVRHLRLPGLTDVDTRTLLDRLGVRGSDPAITAFFSQLGNHPLLVGVVAGLVGDYRAAPGDFDRWLADPTAGSALSVPGLDLTQRRTHILAAALNGLEPGPRRLLGWISVLVGAATWDTLVAINPFQPEPPPPAEPDLAALGAPPNFFPYRQVNLASDVEPPGWADDELVDGQEEAQGQLMEWEIARRRLSEEAGHQTEEQMAAWRSSEPVLRAKAQLDAALKDLEDRGLVWWDRSSNSYDLHPIIRAYAHEQLEETDRIQANDRVRDHFEALPPEDLERASSVEELTQTITIFRALIGAGHLGQASSLWASFDEVLLVDLGAHATVIELLGPLATKGSIRAQGDLALAYRAMGMFDEAIRQDTYVLADRVEVEDDEESGRSLNRLASYLRDMGAYLAAGRCFDLYDALNAALGYRPNGSQFLARAIQAVLQGKVEQALGLLSKAQEVGPPTTAPWFYDDVEYWRLYLALVADQSLTHAQLDQAASGARSWKLRRRLAGLRYELFVQEGEFEQALAAAHEYEQLGRNAGLEVASAETAFLLARLGRASEGIAAIEESLARFPRIHPVQWPHRDLARALWELGRRPEAVLQARDAYRQAWHDGPPNHDHWALRDARELLQAMGEPIPDLPTRDPATVKAPLEDKVRAYIAQRAASRRSGP